MLLLVAFSSCTTAPELKEGSLSGDAPIVRVAVARKVDGITLAVNSTTRIVDDATGEPLFRLGASESHRIVPISGGFKVGEAIVPAARVRIEPEKSGTVVINGIAYRGRMRLISARIDDRGFALTAVNIVNLEEYLCGVVGSEMPTRWPLDSLRAQAIAARTYAVYQLKTRPRAGDYDLTNGQECQVYTGLKKENDRVRRVVVETRGLILTHEWKVFQSYFHSTCGGGTVKAKDVFGDPDIQPLSGAKCTFCESSPAYSWSVTFTKDEIRKKLLARNIKVGPIEKIMALNSDQTGRAINLTIYTPPGPISIDAYRFRLAVGSMKIKGTRMTITDAGDSVTFTGKGFGHYLGMCQFGALGMAQAGHNAARILSHYYPGSELTRLYD
jgi:stage II sporulation protein D